MFTLLFLAPSDYHRVAAASTFLWPTLTNDMRNIWYFIVTMAEMKQKLTELSYKRGNFVVLSSIHTFTQKVLNNAHFLLLSFVHICQTVLCEPTKKKEETRKFGSPLCVNFLLSFMFVHANPTISIGILLYISPSAFSILFLTASQTAELYPRPVTSSIILCVEPSGRFIFRSDTSLLSSLRSTFTQLSSSRLYAFTSTASIWSV